MDHGVLARVGPGPPSLQCVAIAHPQFRAASARAQGNPAPRWVRAVYADLAVLLAAYLVSLLVRSPTQSIPLVDGLGGRGVRARGQSVCASGAPLTSRRRAVPLLLGLGILVLDPRRRGPGCGIRRRGHPSRSRHSPIFSISPSIRLVYVGAGAPDTQNTSTGLGATTWLDGAVAGLGAAALCACFAFNTILHSVGGSTLSVATNLAYPIGRRPAAHPRRRWHGHHHRPEQDPVVAGRRRDRRSPRLATPSTSSPAQERPHRSAPSSTAWRGRARSCSSRSPSGCARCSAALWPSTRLPGFLLPGPRRRRGTLDSRRRHAASGQPGGGRPGHGNTDHRSGFD